MYIYIYSYPYIYIIILYMCVCISIPLTTSNSTDELIATTATTPMLQPFLFNAAVLLSVACHLRS